MSMLFKLSVLFSVSKLVFSSESSNTSCHLERFNEWVSKHKIKLDTESEFERVFSIWVDNDQYINYVNELNMSYKLAHNQFSGMDSDEFKKYLGLDYNAEIFTTYLSEHTDKYSLPSVTNTSSLPTSVDWRDKNAVTPVKDQGQCGSCWTFSSTGAIEGSWAISKGQLLDLSEQQLVDCATGFKYGSHGCNGGQMEGAFKYVIENGQCTELSYSYSAKDGTCQKCQSSVTMSRCYDVKPNDQLSLKSAVFRQPVSVAIEADTFYFQSYSTGVLTSDKCGTKLDHGVLVVGYGSENGNDYWLVKNSWGTSWGDKGYVKIGRSDSTNDPGICGIAMQPSYPVV